MNLFTLFHANLAFSSIPSRHYDWILDNCYWPLLSFVAATRTKTGLEMSGETLKILENIDPAFVAELRCLCDEGLIEPVSGGQHQSIGPLMPAPDNLLNYRLGKKTFQQVLNQDTGILYLPEQTVSQGIADLIVAAGYETVFVEWNNTVRFGKEGVARELLFVSPTLRTPKGARLNILWNHSVLFQKVQRYVFGDISMEDVLNYLDQESRRHDGILCFYGSDLEVFGHFPGHTLQFDPCVSKQRWGRFQKLMDAVCRAHTFMLPSEGRLHHGVDTEVVLGSPAFPILCKKQPKYNPVRWNVCGRGAYQLNRACFSLSEKISLMRNTGAVSTDTADRLRETLAPCWASDFRTYTTEDKWTDANARLHEAKGNVAMAVSQIRNRHQLRPDEMLLITDKGDTNMMVVDEYLRFPPKAVMPGAMALISKSHGNGTPPPVPVQWEEIHTYPDGSVRSGRAVMMLQAQAPTMAIIRFCGGEPNNIVKPTGPEVPSFYGKTEVTFNMKRGMSIDTLRFPDIFHQPLVGTIPHGYFESIDWDADFYSGGAQIDTGMDFYHDLAPVSSVVTANGPIRSMVQGIISMGPLKQKKTYHIYHDASRLDLEQEFMIRQLGAASFRTGIVTLLPGAWRRQHLCFMTHNGGDDFEKYSLAGQRVTHSEPVKTGVSSRSCLGATNGWTAFSDGEKTITLARNKMAGHNAPLLRYEEIGNHFFARLYHSIGERDETSMFAFRGLVSERLSIEGKKGNVTGGEAPSYMVLQPENPAIQGEGR